MFRVNQSSKPLLTEGKQSLDFFSLNDLIKSNPAVSPDRLKSKMNQDENWGKIVKSVINSNIYYIDTNQFDNRVGKIYEVYSPYIYIQKSKMPNLIINNFIDFMFKIYMMYKDNPLIKFGFGFNFFKYEEMETISSSSDVVSRITIFLYEDSFQIYLYGNNQSWLQHIIIKELNLLIKEPIVEKDLITVS